MGKLVVRILLAVGFAALGDYLLYGHPAGCGLSVFSLVLAAVLLFRYRHRAARTLPWLLVWIVVALGAALQASLAGFTVLVFLGWGLVAMARLASNKPLFESTLRGAWGGARAFLSPLVEFLRYRMVRKRFAGGRFVPAWVIVIPVAVILLFAALIIPANLVLADWLRRFADVIGEWLEDVTPVRILFWLVVAAHTYGLLRFVPMRIKEKIWKGARTLASDAFNVKGLFDDAWRANELKSAVITFAGLNVLYLAANLTDAAYLWLALKLPEGLTYSKFAHQGSYRLIAAVVLAAATVTLFCRKGALASERRAARSLAFLFVAQNCIVLAGAARRLQLYVEVYGLTRFRVAAFLWMLLVLVGFVLILLKLSKNLSFYFLVRTNTVSLALLLSIVSLLDLNAFIAEWNVERYERGAPTAVDVEYLRHLGSSALPSLARLIEAGDEDVRAEAEPAFERVLSRSMRASRHWQSKTLYRERNVRKALHMLHASGGDYAAPPSDTSRESDSGLAERASESY